MEWFIKDKYEMGLDKDMEFSHGLMEQNIEGIGKMIRLKVMVL